LFSELHKQNHEDYLRNEINVIDIINAIAADTKKIGKSIIYSLKNNGFRWKERESPLFTPTTRDPHNGMKKCF